MNENGPLASTFASGISGAISIATINISATLSALAAVFAIIAAVYSIRVSRSKLRHEQAEDERICEECRRVGNHSLCPYPVDSRPAKCVMRKVE